MVSIKVNQSCHTIKIMHEYLTGYDRYLYGQCIDCGKRTLHFCFICRYCYSCHYKIEKQNRENNDQLFLTAQQIIFVFVNISCIGQPCSGIEFCRVNPLKFCLVMLLLRASLVISFYPADLLLPKDSKNIIYYKQLERNRIPPEHSFDCRIILEVEGAT